MKKLKDILAENMRRFHTKNLNENNGLDPALTKKYYCQRLSLDNMSAEFWGDDIDEAFYTDDASDIIMITDKFIEWFNDNSIQKAQDLRPGEEDLDQLEVLRNFPIDQLQRALKLFKVNRNNTQAKNAIQNLISGLFDDMDM
jgi:hypothetical protein